VTQKQGESAKNTGSTQTNKGRPEIKSSIQYLIQQSILLAVVMLFFLEQKIKIALKNLYTTLNIKPASHQKAGPKQLFFCTKRTLWMGR
jgi:hypothetical protein